MSSCFTSWVRIKNVRVGGRWIQKSKLKNNVKLQILWNTKQIAWDKVAPNYISHRFYLKICQLLTTNRITLQRAVGYLKSDLEELWRPYKKARNRLSAQGQKLALLTHFLSSKKLSSKNDFFDDLLNFGEFFTNIGISKMSNAHRVFWPWSK